MNHLGIKCFGFVVGMVGLRFTTGPTFKRSIVMSFSFDLDLPNNLMFLVYFSDSTMELDNLQ